MAGAHSRLGIQGVKRACADHCLRDPESPPPPPGKTEPATHGVLLASLPIVHMGGPKGLGRARVSSIQLIIDVATKMCQRLLPHTKAGSAR